MSPLLLFLQELYKGHQQASHARQAPTLHTVWGLYALSELQHFRLHEHFGYHLVQDRHHSGGF